MIDILAAHIRSGHTAKVLVHERDELVECRLPAVAPRNQQLRDSGRLPVVLGHAPALRIDEIRQGRMSVR
jgi:hypothetical protein